MSLPKRTVLFAEHLKLGARMTNFAGFEMPVQYRSIIEEHRAVRTSAGVFDLSHMGEFEVAGPRALELLERALNAALRRVGWRLAKRAIARLRRHVRFFATAPQQLINRKTA